MDRNEVTAVLAEKLNRRWEDYKRLLTGYSSTHVFDQAQEIAVTRQVFEELTSIDYPVDMLEYLLRFEDPLEVVRDKWLEENDVCIDEEMTHALASLMDSGDAERVYDLDPVYLPVEDSASLDTEPEKALKTLRLYYPAKVMEYGCNDYGDRDYDATEVSPRKAATYFPEVMARLATEQDDAEMERGLMVYYHEDDPLNAKMFSAKPSAAVIGGRLYGMAVCRVYDDLTNDEMRLFRDFWSGQMSDGFGEGFEQREIPCHDDSEIYVSFWNADDSWSIQTKEEMDQKQQSPRPQLEQRLL